MKTTPRIHRNGAAETASLQRQTSIRKPAKADPFAPPKNMDGEQACVCIYDLASGKPTQRVPLTNDEIVMTLTQCLLPGSPQKTSGEFIAAAIRDKLRRDGVCEALAEIDSATVDLGFVLERIDAGDLNPMIERLKDRLIGSVVNAFAALRGEPAAS